MIDQKSILFEATFSAVYRKTGISPGDRDFFMEVFSEIYQSGADSVTITKMTEVGDQRQISEMTTAIFCARAAKSYTRIGKQKELLYCVNTARQILEMAKTK